MEYNYKKLSDEQVTESLANTDKVLMNVDGKICQATVDQVVNASTLRSHVGMVIHSTTLDTEAKVIAIYGGTKWEKIEGRFLLGQSSAYDINSTGGEAKHILTTNEMPVHSHAERLVAWGYDGWTTRTLPAYSMVFPYSNTDQYLPRNYTLHANTVSANTTSGDAGSGQGHNNMPPYKTVYIWERTA